MRRPSAWQGLPLLTLIFIGVAPLISVAQNPSNGSAEAEAAPIVIDMAAPLEPERAPPPPTEPSALGVYRAYIESMETSGGAFAPGLTEQLLGLGLNLQALDRHAEAAKVFKRGVHVSRVQSGLYAADQIPLLRAEIRSLIALGRFDEVDEHQRYLARVESQALTGTPASIASSATRKADSEVCSAGFTTIEHPAARAGPIFQASISSGKFHGRTAPTTPIGSRTTSAIASSPTGAVWS